jgi:hypothetical protein
MSLLRPSQMRGIQKIANRGLNTTIVIERIDFESDELGDDAETEPVVIATVKGWIHSTPTPEATLDGGIVTANTYRLNVPVGTDIRPRDYVEVGGTRYVVTDTTSDETWPAFLTCSLRLRE